MLRLVQNYNLHIIYFVHQWVKMTISCHPVIDGNVNFVLNASTCATLTRRDTDDERGIGRQIQIILFLTARWDVVMTQLSIYWQVHLFLLNDELWFNQITSKGTKAFIKSRACWLSRSAVLEKRRWRSKHDARRPSNIPPGETPSEALVWRW